MSRNQNSYFALNPRVNIKRSRMDLSFSHLTTANAADIVPFMWKEILPGDTFNVRTGLVARMQTPLTPIFSDVYCDTYYFFVPNRLIFKDWQHFMGESDEPWYDDTVYSVPQIDINMGSRQGTACVGEGTVADHLGMPLAPESGTDVLMKKVNHLPIRAYVRVFNDWFRNESTQGLAAFNSEANDVTMDNTGAAFYGGQLLKANKFRDYFTSCLPGPQRLPSPVTIGVGSTAPVFTQPLNHSFSDLLHGQSVGTPLQFASIEDKILPSGSHDLRTITGTTDTKHASTFIDAASVSQSSTYTLMPSNLYADISAATGISINELRLAFATQQFYELSARSGNRYIEMLEAMFGVTSPDARLQRSEYLGGNRLGISINQVLQQSETNETPLGNVGAYSLTTDSQRSFVHSFVEHGILLGVFVIRYDHLYQNGYERSWFRRDKFDYYFPQFNGVGEMPVLNREIYADGTAADEEVFGYQEAYGEYRFSNSIVSGNMRSGISRTLDSWHLADDYISRPSLSADWTQENGEVIDRVLAVSSRLADQFLLDFHIGIDAVRPMPLYAVPGLDRL